MGAWGTGLYEDDTALDIQSAVKNGISMGEDIHKIIDILCKEYDIHEGYQNDEETVFWCAIADTLWEHGIFDEEVKQKAISLIEQGGDTERWQAEAPALAADRKRVLLKLKEKLISPPKKVKKIKSSFYKCPWKPGDVFALRLKGEMAQKKGLLDTYLIFQVRDKYLFTEGGSMLGHECPIILSKLSFKKDLPTIDDLTDDDIIIRDRTRNAIDVPWKIIYSTLMYTESEDMIPKDLIYLGNKEIIKPHNDYGVFHDLANAVNNMSFTLWTRLEDDIVKDYFDHNLKEYEQYSEEPSQDEEEALWSRVVDTMLTQKYVDEESIREVIDMVERNGYINRWKEEDATSLAADKKRVFLLLKEKLMLGIKKKKK